MKNLWSVVSNRSKRLKLSHFGTLDFKLQNLSQRIKVSASQDSLRVRKHLWLIGMDVDKFTCKSMILLRKYQCNMSPVFRSNDDWTETDKNRVNLLSTCALYQNSNDNHEHSVSHLLTVQTTIKLNTMQKPHPFSHPTQQTVFVDSWSIPFQLFDTFQLRITISLYHSHPTLDCQHFEFSFSKLELNTARK